MAWAKRMLLIAPVAAIAAAIVWAFWPKPVPVELAGVTRQPFEVTVTQPGRSRVKDRFLISAPLGGQLLRPSLHAGDRVTCGQVLLRIVPLPPPLLDARTRAQAEARVRAAEAARAQAGSQREAVSGLLQFARAEVRRQRQLAAAGTAALRALEVAELDERSRGKELASSDAGLQVASYELQQARAALLRLTTPGRAGETVEVRAPIAGVVLRVLQESEGPVAPGTPLVELGDVSRLEAVVELLTQDAVRISPGARVQIERWGGPQPLGARVRRVEPGGFTKVSALGVEEQRVAVVVDLDDPPPELGDGFRVEARITLYAAADRVQVPGGALFRSEGNWAVFIAEGDRLRLRKVDLGERSDTAAEVRSGLHPGDRVVLHPGERIRDGVRFRLAG